MSSSNSSTKSFRESPFVSRRRIKIAVAMLAILFVLSLSLGLGLGLRHRHGKHPASKPQQSPSPNNTAGGNTFGVWQPGVNTAWQIVLNSQLDPKSALSSSAEVYDIDLFDNPKATFDSLRGAGKKSICYFSAGSYEPYRPDSSSFRKEDLGSELDGWPDEQWLNINSPSVRQVLSSRIRLAKEKGCDAIDPDNVDVYSHDSGFKVTKSDSIDFIKFLSQEAKSQGLSIGLKNAAEIIPDVLPNVHFSINEQCSEYDECNVFSAFVKAGKPVFRIEYPDGAGGKVDAGRSRDICSCRGSEGFSTVLKSMDLDGWVQYCNGDIEVTAVVNGHVFS